MSPAIIVMLGLLIALAAPLERRLGVATPILLLLIGAGASFVPGLPPVTIGADLVLMGLLPPLLYLAGVNMSWRGFRSNLRPILLLAIGCVLFTAVAVAAVAHYALGLPWAVGFVLGAIVSPPDAVAPIAILRRVGLPRRITTVLEGESLVNDATALVALSFAITAVATGGFSLSQAAASFAVIVVGESLWGLAVGFGSLWLRHRLRDPRAEILLSLMAPFIAFWPPHDLGGSGVVACVAAGLTVSWNGRGLIRPATRLQGFFFWGLIGWTVEGLIFLLTGLQARSVVDSLAGRDWGALLGAGALIAVTVVLIRFVWVFPATYVPRLLSRSLRERDPHPNWRAPFVIGFTGLRGVVSLAAALSVPVVANGEPFPERDLLLFLTFCVIVATLVGQGLVLPLVVRRLGLVDTGRAEALANKRDEQAARLEAIDAARAELGVTAGDVASPTAAGTLDHLLTSRRRDLANSADEGTSDDPFGDVAALQLQLVEAERRAVNRIYEENRITDEARRRIERELDLEDARVRHARSSAASAAEE